MTKEEVLEAESHPIDCHCKLCVRWHRVNADAEEAWLEEEAKIDHNAANREKALEPLIAEVKETNRLLRLLLESKGLII